MVQWPAPTVGDNCEVAGWQCVPPSSHAFPVGTTTVTCTATDTSSNTAACTFVVTVEDREDPQITCPADVTVSCAADVPAVDLGAVLADDNCGEVTVIDLGEQSDGGTCPEVITRTFRAVDSCGNAAECTQRITVHDTEAPQVTCPPQLSILVETDGSTGKGPFPDLTGTATAEDNCTAQTEITIEQEPPPGSDVTPGGEMPVSLTATDLHGNERQCQVTVVIESGVGVHLQLKPKWNLLALPDMVAPPATTRRGLTGGISQGTLPLPSSCHAGTVSGWVNGTYARFGDGFPAGVAFWVYCAGTPGEIPILYGPNEDTSVHGEGWALLGVSAPTTAAEFVATRAGILAIWRWEALEQRYVRVEQDELMVPGVGYWAFFAGP